MNLSECLNICNFYDIITPAVLFLMLLQNNLHQQATRCLCSGWGRVRGGMLIHDLHGSFTSIRGKGCHNISTSFNVKK